MQEVITCIEDLRRLHARRVPRMFYDYVDSGAWTESTYRANEKDFESIRLRQKVMVDLANRSLRSQMIGQDVSIPVALAPAGLTGMQWGNGEILAARAAERFGVPFTLSTMSICSIEDVAEVVTKPFWFQLYVMRDRDYIARLIDRARVAECSALMLTLDLQIMGQRHKDLKNGLTVPPRPTLANMLNILSCPAWCLSMLTARRRHFGNVVGHVPGVESLRSLGAWSAQQLDPSLCWDDVQWIRDRWPGRLILKGIMDPDDAERAAGFGVDAMVVSNHGGRQLDGAPSTISVLPDILAAVGERTEVWMDGGVRSGQDVFKALALGARGVLIGRAYLFGLGAMGEAGVDLCLRIIANELDLTMAFCGLTDITDVSREVIWSR